MITSRILTSAALLVSIIILPYWIYVLVLFAAAIAFPLFWEGIVLAFLIDVLYGNGIEALPSLVSPFALAVLVAVIVLMPLRENIRSYV